MDWDPDFEYVCAVQKVLGERADERGLESLSGPELIVQLTWWAKGIVDNGSLTYFYEGASNAEQVADAFDALGFPAAAAAFRKSMSVFPGGQPHEDHDERCRWIESHEAAADWLLSIKLNAPIVDLEDELTQALVAYIREHRSEFTGVDGLERVYER
jgi:Domain of unknown function (DUF4375)